MSEARRLAAELRTFSGLFDHWPGWRSYAAPLLPAADVLDAQELELVALREANAICGRTIADLRGHLSAGGDSSRLVKAQQEKALLGDAFAELAVGLASVEAFLRAQPLAIEAGRRLTVQQSIDSRKILVVVEIGPHGSGRKLWCGKDLTLLGALSAAVQAAETDPELPRAPA